MKIIVCIVEWIEKHPEANVISETGKIYPRIPMLMNARNQTFNKYEQKQQI